MTESTQRFFISYAGPDRPWAEWVAWHLERAGHEVTLDVWDWRTGDDFVRLMDSALGTADAVVALFSKSYFEPGRWTEEEWNATVARRDRIVPLALEPISTDDVPPILAPRLRKDLHGLDETAALAALREAIDGGARPTSSPAFPGTPPSAEPASAPDDTQPRLPSSAGLPDVWNVRRSNPDFSGREAELTRLREGLLSPRQSPVQVLHGMGGIGKTQIALAYAHRFGGQYDLVWWIDAEQADQLPVHYTELADRLGIAKPDAGSEHNARALLQHLRDRQRWLLILDNAEDPGQIETWLPEGPGHVLITSRNPDWQGVAHQTGLDVFTRSDAVAYLELRVPGIAPDQADALAKELGDLPLALAQAAGVVGSGMTLDRYRRLVTTSTARILKEGEAPGYPATLAASVDIATNHLGGDHPDALALLRLGAFFGPEPIPTAWLEDARPRLSTIPGDPDDLMWPHTALQPLSRYGLARVDHEAFQIHRLTQAVLRDQTDAEQVRTIHGDVAAVLGDVDPGDPETPDTWLGWAALASHLTAQHVVLADRPELRVLLLRAVLFLIRSGQPQSAHGLTTSLRQSWVSELGEEHPDTLTCTQYLGHATSDLGDLKGALPLIQDTFVRRQRTLGDDHPDTLHSANDLAVILRSSGANTEVHRMYEDTLARRRRTLGDDHPDTLQSAHNLAGTMRVFGKLDESRRMHEDILTRRRRTLGDDHPDTLHSSQSLGITLHDLRELDESRRMHEDTLTRRRRVLGDDHPNTLRSAHSLAATLHDLRELNEARRMHEDTLTRQRRVLGDDHPDTLHSSHSLGITLHNLHNLGEARRMHEDTLARRRRTLGDDHPDTLQSTHNLGTTLRLLDKPHEAHRLHEDAFTRMQHAFGSDHPETLQSAHSLAITLYALRRHPEAIQLLEETRGHLRRTLGDQHRDTRSVTDSLATVLTETGQRFKAQRLLAQQKPKKRRFGKKSR
ncbi:MULTISPECIES: FxSxx-COOH system tetratricopeptide repeat protein [unclassified Streptomyces]|uniref:FxSxx-COOH system tetratricopeptide repeat protein n=1 Tax=unclassified Streptomyces TaxID=2593676 RepID=UPI0006AE652A|nr:MULTISPECIES: FxSxx-COOH system tetratricopeptide repeat protein [unclassified Streptomyces]KOX33346.1 ATP-binding protein [Streptomyces sp. NRRL F-6491]KOX49583.1 ATP-binding protein [Streptomyces sp. NRRL F-6492]